MNRGGGAELPHDLLAEKSLLGCLLIDGRAFDEISELALLKEDFHHPQHGMVYQAIKDLATSAEPIDYISVCAKLNTSGKLETVGGRTAILELQEDTASSANIYHYAKVVKDLSLLREIIRTAQRVSQMGLNLQSDLGEFVSDVESSFFKLTSETRRGGLRDIKEFLRQNVKDLEAQDRAKGEISGLSTGFKAMDQKILGMQPGQMIVIAARPGMGKTSLVNNLVIHAAKTFGLPCVFFSLEMMANELSMRMLSGEAGVDSKKLRTKSLNEYDLKNLSKAIQELSNLPIHINDSPDCNLIEMRSQCRKIKAEKGAIGMVVIDYLQLMQPHTDSRDRVQQVSEISRGLKNLSKELECPILALSQLNRGSTQRTDKRPMLSDLRESGAIEQDADIVLLIHREEVYNPDTPLKGIGEIIVAKNRAGETGTVKLAWIGSQTKFAELAPEYQNDYE